MTWRDKAGQRFRDMKRLSPYGGPLLLKKNQSGDIITPEDCDFGLSFKPFTYTGLFPLRDMQTDQIIKQVPSTDGWFFTGLIPGPGGPPFGAHRIIPITLAIKAQAQHSRKIEFSSWRELLVPLGLSERAIGRDYKMLHEGIRRLGESRFWFGHLCNVEGRWRDDREYWQFITGHRQWYDESMRPLERPPRGEKFGLILSEEFYADVRTRGVRVNLTLLRHLTHNWGAFDLALWLGPRAQAVKKGAHAAVSLTGEGGLVHQLAVNPGIAEKELRRQVDGWMRTVAPVWRKITGNQLPLRWARHRRSLVINHDEIIPPNSLSA